MFLNLHFQLVGICIEAIVAKGSAAMDLLISEFMQAIELFKIILYD
jgi:hypothetical protein